MMLVISNTTHVEKIDTALPEPVQTDDVLSSPHRHSFLFTEWWQNLQVNIALLQLQRGKRRSQYAMCPHSDI